MILELEWERYIQVYDDDGYVTLRTEVDENAGIARLIKNYVGDDTVLEVNLKKAQSPNSLDKVDEKTYEQAKTIRGLLGLCSSKNLYPGRGRLLTCRINGAVYWYQGMS